MNKNRNNPYITTRRAITILLTLLAALVMLLVALTACTPNALTTDPVVPAPGQGTTLLIGSLNVGTPTSPTGKASTRIGIDDEAFAEGDEIQVKAMYSNLDDPTGEDIPNTAIYTLGADGVWVLKAIEGNDPIIVERISTAPTPFTISSWGGKAGKPANYSEEDQSTEEYYRYSDRIESTTAKLTGRTLTATMGHQHVDIVVRITNAHGNELPATLRTGGKFTLNSGMGVKAWNATATTGDAANTATFRACVNFSGVPGIGGGIGNTVTPGSLLGTLTYTPDGGSETSFNIRYSIKDNATVSLGQRITVNVPWDNLTPVASGTATVSAWEDVDGGETNTDDPANIAISTGMEGDLNMLTADKPTWVITGGGETIFSNVKTTLNAIYKENNDARINVILTGFEGAIPDNAFEIVRSGCYALASISAPRATSIGEYAFNDCINLATVNLPAATSIGIWAFNNCDALVTIDLPAATSIGTDAFNACKALTTISLPAATSIGDEAFGDCTNLATISLPAATSIGIWAFNNCDALTTLKLTQSDKPISMASDAFSNIGTGTTAITLVLASNDPEVLEKTDVTIEDAAEGKKKVTFANRATFTFKAVEYLSSRTE